MQQLASPSRGHIGHTHCGRAPDAAKCADATKCAAARLRCSLRPKKASSTGLQPVAACRPAMAGWAPWPVAHECSLSPQTPIKHPSPRSAACMHAILALTQQACPNKEPQTTCARHGRDSSAAQPSPATNGVQHKLRRCLTRCALGRILGRCRNHGSTLTPNPTLLPCSLLARISGCKICANLPK